MPPRTINLSITHEPIAKTFFLKATVFLQEGWGQGKGTVSTYKCSWETWDPGLGQDCPASSSLKLLHLDLVDRHSATLSVLAERSLLVTFSTSAMKYLTENYEGEIFILLVASEFWSTLMWKVWCWFTADGSCSWALLTSQYQSGDRTGSRLNLWGAIPS